MLIVIVALVIAVVPMTVALVIAVMPITVALVIAVMVVTVTVMLPFRVLSGVAPNVVLVVIALVPRKSRSGKHGEKCGKDN
jgi:hypothetical protein